MAIPVYAKKYHNSKLITSRNAITIDTNHLGNQKKITKSNRRLITKSVITLAMLGLLSLIGFSIYTRNQHSDDIKLLRAAYNEQLRLELTHKNTGCEGCRHNINFFTMSNENELNHFYRKSLLESWDSKNKIGLGEHDKNTLSLYIYQYFQLWYQIKASKRSVPTIVEKLATNYYSPAMLKRIHEERTRQRFNDRLRIIADVPGLTAEAREQWTEADIREIDFILREVHYDIEEFVTALERTEPKDETTLQIRRMFFTDSNEPTNLRKLMQKPDLIRWAMAIPSVKQSMLQKLERFIPGSAI